MDEQSRLMIIDDEQVIIDSVVKLCSAEGWEVDSALDAMKGIKKISQKKYHLIICDIMMPEVDGFQFLDEMSRQQLEIPVIITTGYSTVENAVKSLSSGAICFLAKPFTVDELISVVSRGLKYNQIFEARKSKGQLEDSSVSFVSCPGTYYCLGYAQWSNRESDGTVRIGVTDLFLRTIEEIRQIELFDLEEELIQGNPCANIITIDEQIHHILSPVSGKIIERNEKHNNQKDLIIKDPFFKGWLYTLIPSDPNYEFNNLT